MKIGIFIPRPVDHEVPLFQALSNITGVDISISIIKNISLGLDLNYCIPLTEEFGSFKYIYQNSGNNKYGFKKIGAGLIANYRLK